MVYSTQRLDAFRRTALSLLVIISAVETCQAQYVGRGFLQRRIEDPQTILLWPGQSPDTNVDGLDAAIVTDRPDFTEASSVVGRGVVQLETGYTYGRDRQFGNSVHSHSYPETLFRIGVLPSAELRLGTNYSSTRSLLGTERGAEDLYLGTKLGLYAQRDILPKLAIIPQMPVPTGGAQLTSDRVLPGLNCLYGWSLSDKYGFYASSQFQRAADGGTNSLYNIWAQSATLNREVNDKISLYAEFFSLMCDGADTDRTQSYFNGGLNLLFNNNFKWDVRAGVRAQRCC